MNRSAIGDQNNDNIIDDPKDIREEDVEDDDDINNEVVHISCLSFTKAKNWASSQNSPKPADLVGLGRN